ncbi:MAG: hypothetical protein MPEBLZ_04023 [Candidatus Methanoperedens nitroreducens]|uniref:DUF3467 domain-containing protein n=1 Tax=Candidatus Methanoperedens nitratireducens TaxID=1392998 RepID=A0A0P8ABP4_9EURY|nr:DUF3467 domain-containing protein [Candidatus Methanoperedens sp. BLZ2]KAB2942681.1 MAG: DUF3467 domain-containing protein [Candidatus Methanoperedens sp.]KPQ41424.1 MAG: hypothetical protein MPEBLZ_04023 [Candidatus Methanoperedens sp. BLZ1]MBZ0177473.1 DUF3467 domain-containing protein [Candidatus Methanoperedens nitroreducens]MCX9079165.1 DUF3467 domain-containing protein [Candidatus Methanoperedens sp.]
MTEENDSIPDIYTNNLTVSGTVYELLISFRLQTPQNDGTTSDKEILRVRMSPQQALALSILLNNSLKSYNETFKEIFLPDSLLLQLKGEEPVETGSEE